MSGQSETRKKEEMCVMKASLSAAGWDLGTEHPPVMMHLQDGARVGKALVPGRSSPFTEALPWEHKSPLLLGVLALGVRVQAPNGKLSGTLAGGMVLHSSGRNQGWTDLCCGVCL